MIVEGESAERIDRAIARHAPELSRRRARNLIEAGRVFLDGRRCFVSSRIVSRGARILVHLEDDADARGETAKEPELAILYEDEDVVVIDKAPGIHVNVTETAASFALVERLHGRDAYTVHRIDRGTSGVVIFAKGRRMAEALSRAFHDRLAKKTYVAVVRGPIADGVIDAPIGRDPRRPRARAVNESGKGAETRVRLISRIGDLAALEVEPITGRTHQIRVHLSHRGAPIVGDALYGGAMAIRIGATEIRATRTLLHASRLAIPIRGAIRTFEAPLPRDMIALERAGLAFGPLSA